LIFYISLESFALTSSFLVSYGITVREREIGLTYFFINMFASLLFIFSFALFNHCYGTIDFSTIAVINHSYVEYTAELYIAVFLFILAFFVKLGVPPFSF